jgi:hypothetical protein
MKEKDGMTSRQKLAIPLLILALVGLACTLPNLALFQPTATPAGSVRPKFVNHPAPAITMDLKPFEAAGCKKDPEGDLRCPPSTPPFDQIGCDEIVQANPLLGALKPGASLMLCLLEPTNPDEQVDPANYLYNQGCTQNAIYVRYVVYLNGKFQLVKSMAELKALVGPVQSPEQALSYALAGSGLQALYGLKDDNLRYQAGQIEDSYVQSGAEGYTVLLYAYNLCGCGPHATSRQAVKVSPQGDLTIDAARPVWEDPTKDDVCVD